MPIYEYLCQACGETTEALRKISDPPLTRCPACHEEALKKKVSAAAFRLKGGGWYETDFKTGSRKNIAGGEGGDGKQASGDEGSAGKGGGEGKAGEGRASGGETTAKGAGGKEGSAAVKPGKGKPPGGSSSAA